MDPTNAQVTDPNAVVQEQQADPNAGFQARINELTAKAREAEERNNTLMQKMVEQQAQQTQLLSQLSQPARQPSPLEVHGASLAPEVKAILEHQQMQFQAQLAANQATMEARLGAMTIQTMAANNRNIPAEVTAKAAQLYQQARLAGANPTPDEALKFSLGEWYLAQQAKAGAALGVPHTAFNAPVPSFNGQPAPVQPQRASLPANLESLPLEQQIALMEKAGVGDMPL